MKTKKTEKQNLYLQLQKNLNRIYRFMQNKIWSCKTTCLIWLVCLIPYFFQLHAHIFTTIHGSVSAFKLTWGSGTEFFSLFRGIFFNMLSFPIYRSSCLKAFLKTNTSEKVRENNTQKIFGFLLLLDFGTLTQMEFSCSKSVKNNR